MAVKPIPDNYERMIPYLTVSNAAEAIDFYKKAFGAEELVRMPGPGGKIMHAELKVNGHMMFLGDETQNKSAKTMGGCPMSLMMYVEDVDKFFAKAQAAGAEILAKPETMFWGDKLGRLKDPEGYVWAVATHVEDVTPEEMQKRMAAMAH